MATRTIDTEITLKGEREFNQQMKAVNSNLKTLRSDMALVTSEFTGNANSVDALRAKQEVLQRQYDQQREKVRALTAMMEDARKSLGEDSAEYDKYRTQVNNATVQLNTFGRDLEQTNQYLDEAQKSTDGTASSIDEFGKAAKKGGEQSDKMGDEVKSAGDKSEGAAKKFEKARDAAEAMGKVAAAATAAIAAAAVKLGKEAVDAYAEYEQLVGGVETLFGEDAAHQVVNNARVAYMSAGLSANEYLDTVTSVSASLINSLGGDTVAAAEYANRAIIDMADNANKMGTDISSIQNAYAGFAKGQYNMLDNLKLGYSGSKEGMEQLLAAAQQISGIEYNIESYADIVDAIHAVQESMGIAGATAVEASTTISGSIGMLKGAWTNLVAGLGDSNADVSALAENVMYSFGLVIGNVSPIIQNLTASMPGAVRGIIDALAPMLPDLINTGAELMTSIIVGIAEAAPTIAPAAGDAVAMLIRTLTSPAVLTSIIEAGVTMITSLIDTLADASADIAPTLTDALSGIVGSLSDARMLTSMITIGTKLIGNLLRGLMDNLPTVINTVTSAAASIAPTVIDAISDVAGSLGDTSILSDLLAFGSDVIINLLDGLIANLPAAVDTLTELIIDTITTLAESALSMLPELLDAGSELMTAMIEGLGAVAPEIIPRMIEAVITMVTTLTSSDSLSKIIASAETMVQTLVASLTSTIPELVPVMANAILTMVTALGEHAPEIFKTGVALLQQLLTSIAQSIPELVPVMIDAITTIVTTLWDNRGQLLEAGKDLIRGLWEGITSMGSWLIDMIGGWASGIISGFKSAFGINSPSRVMREQVGHHIGTGTAYGIEDGFDDVLPEVLRDVQANLDTSFDLTPNVRLARGIRTGTGSTDDTGSAERVGDAPTRIGGGKPTQIITYVQIDKKTVGKAVTEYQADERRSRQ